MALGVPEELVQGGKHRAGKLREGIVALEGLAGLGTQGVQGPDIGQEALDLEGRRPEDTAEVHCKVQEVGLPVDIADQEEDLVLVGIPPVDRLGPELQGRAPCDLGDPRTALVGLVGRGWDLKQPGVSAQGRTPEALELWGARVATAAAVAAVEVVGVVVEGVAEPAEVVEGADVAEGLGEPAAAVVVADAAGVVAVAEVAEAGPGGAAAVVVVVVEAAGVVVAAAVAADVVVAAAVAAEAAVDPVADAAVVAAAEGAVVAAAVVAPTAVVDPR